MNTLALTRLQIRFSRGWGLYAGLTLLTSIIFFSALGPGLTQYDPSVWAWSWQRMAFISLCHQMPSRSFTLNGVQMAVCSRCIGIYGSLWLGTLVFPFLGRLFPVRMRIKRYVLAASALIVIIDVIANGLGIWDNTNITRLLTGLLLGFAAAWVLAGDLFRSRLQRSITGG